MKKPPNARLIHMATDDEHEVVSKDYTKYYRWNREIILDGPAPDLRWLWSVCTEHYEMLEETMREDRPFNYLFFDDANWKIK